MEATITVKKLLDSSGMTSSEYAAYFGIPLRTVQSWISNERSGRSCPEYWVKLMEYKLRNEGLIE